MKSKWILSLAVVLMIVSIIFVSCKKADKAETADTVRVDPKAVVVGADMFPQETAFFFSIDWAGLSGVEVIKEEMEEAKSELVDKIGVDIFAGLETISIGILSFDTPKFEDSAIVVAKGIFDKDQILQAISSQEDVESIEELEYEKYTIFTPKGTAEEEISMIFMGKDYVALSSLDLLKKAIDVKNKKHASMNDNKTLVEAIKDIRKGAHIYGVGIIDQKMKDDIGKDPMTASMANIDILSLALAFDPGKYTINLTGKCGSEESAKELFNTINGLWEGMAKPMIMADAQYKDFADAIKIDQKGSSAMLSITLTEEHIELLKGFAPGSGADEDYYFDDFEDEELETEEGIYLQ